MKAFFSVSFVFLVALLMFFYLFAPKKENTARIAVSMAPLKCFAERIVQGNIPITALVHAGQNHETYEISPKEMLLLMNAKLYFSTGFPFEKRWSEKVKELNQKITIVDLQKEIFPGQENRDLHIWTSPRLAKKIAHVMMEKIAKIDPANEPFYRQGYAGLIHDLETLDKEIEKKLAPCREKKMYVVHPAWGYFARDYGLEECSLEKDGKEPSLQDLVSIIESAKKDHVRVIFIQKTANSRSAGVVAHVLQGSVEEIDPLEEDYFSNMRKISSQIQKALVDEKAAH